MSKIFLFLFLLIKSTISVGQNDKLQFVTTDITNFWNAYEKINSTTDSSSQHKYLRELYIEKGTQGLKNLIEVRNSTENDFIDWITKYPNFWKSLNSKFIFLSLSEIIEYEKSS